MTSPHESDSVVSDEALLSGIAIGDERATLTFVRRYQRRLFGLALGILRDPGLAEDVAQEAFMKILRHASVFDPRRGSVSTWALTITRNLAIDAMRIRRAIPTDPSDWIFAGLSSNGSEPDVVAAHSESVARTRAALAALPREQQRAVVLAMIYGKTAAEIATHEAVPLGTAKSRIRLGLAKLREVIVSSDAP